MDDLEDIAVQDADSTPTIVTPSSFTAPSFTAPPLTAPPLTAFFEAEYAAMVRLALLLVDDLATAEEVTQDAFVQLFRLGDGVRPSVSLTGSRLTPTAASELLRSVHRAEPDEVIAFLESLSAS